MDELPQYTLTSPSLHIRQTGSYLQFLFTKLFPQLRWTSSYKIILTSSPLNSDGRAPTSHTDEPLATLQTDGLPPTIHIDELPLHTDGRAPTVHSDEPITAHQTDGLLPTILIDEALPSTQMDELLQNHIDELTHQLRRTGSHLLFISTSSPLNSDGRALTIHTDEPLAALQTDGPLPTKSY